MQYELFSQDLSSSKTSRGLLVPNSKGTGGKIQPEPLFCSMSSENWKEWVTTRRQEYSVRLKSAHRTREKESLSLQGEMMGRPSLPRTAVVECPVEKSENGHNLNWPTPAARDVKGLSGKGRQERKGHPTDTLPNAVAVWPTPTAAEGSKIGSQANYGQVGLSNHPAIVGHPDREKLNKSGKSHESWPTPIQTDCNNVPYQKSKGRKITRIMGKANGKLNPSWVEQLMGLPAGWTQLPTAWIASDCSAMA